MYITVCFSFILYYLLRSELQSILQGMHSSRNSALTLDMNHDSYRDQECMDH